MLQIVGKLATALTVSLNNPLSSDLESSLQYETVNYNNLFVPLPNNPGNDLFELILQKMIKL